MKTRLVVRYSLFKECEYEDVDGLAWCCRTHFDGGRDDRVGHRGSALSSHEVRPREVTWLSTNLSRGETLFPFINQSSELP